MKFLLSWQIFMKIIIRNNVCKRGHSMKKSLLLLLFLTSCGTKTNINEAQNSSNKEVISEQKDGFIDEKFSPYFGVFVGGAPDIYVWNNNNEYFCCSLKKTNEKPSLKSISYYQNNLSCPINEMKKIVNKYYAKDSISLLVYEIPYPFTSENLKILNNYSCYSYRCTNESLYKSLDLFENYQKYVLPEVEQFKKLDNLINGVKDISIQIDDKYSPYFFENVGQFPVICVWERNNEFFTCAINKRATPWFDSLIDLQQSLPCPITEMKNIIDREYFETDIQTEIYLTPFYDGNKTSKFSFTNENICKDENIYNLLGMETYYNWHISE